MSTHSSANIGLRAQAIGLEARKCGGRMTARLYQKKRLTHHLDFTALWTSLRPSGQESPKRQDSPETSCPTPGGATPGSREATTCCGTSAGSGIRSRNLSDRRSNRHALVLYRTVTCGCSNRSRARIFAFQPRPAHGSGTFSAKGTRLSGTVDLTSRICPLLLILSSGHFLRGFAPKCCVLYCK